MSGPDVRVPIKTWLRASTYRAWEARARKEGTTVAVLLAYAAERATQPPAPRKRSYVRITPTMAAEIRALRAEGVTRAELARRFGCSENSIRNWERS